MKTLAQKQWKIHAKSSKEVLCECDVEYFRRYRHTNLDTQNFDSNTTLS